MCGFEPLPTLAMMMDEDEMPECVVHPASMLREAQQRLGLEDGTLQAEGEYQVRVDVVGGPINVLLMGFNMIDPPFDLARRLRAQFIELPEARVLPDVELLLLRRAYEVLIGD